MNQQGQVADAKLDLHTPGVTEDPLIGRTLGGAFVVERTLGQGGMGAVYVARHVRTGKGYAVKVLRRDHGARSEEAAARFQREAAALAELNHPGIVAIQDFARTDDGIDYLVMDLLQGEDLSERMARVGKLPLEESLRIFHEAAVALTIAHETGIIHRDLKPGNVFLRSVRGAPDRAMILDFGLARMTESADAQHLTASGVAMGTPLYMAPEQAAGERVGEPADQYALAVMLYEMLAGEPPFTAPSAPALLVKVLTTTAPTLSELGAAPPHVSAAVARAMAKSPADRFESAAAFLAAVEQDEQAALALTRASDLPPITATRALPATAPPGYAAASPATNPTMRLERAVPMAAGAAVLLAVVIVGGAFAWKATEQVSVTVSDVRTGADGGVARPPGTRQITISSTGGSWVGATETDAGAADASETSKPDARVQTESPDAGSSEHATRRPGGRRRASGHGPLRSRGPVERNAHPSNTPGAALPPGSGLTRDQIAGLEDTARGYEAQINAVDGLLTRISGLRRKSRGIAEGREPALCEPAVARGLSGSSDVPVVVSAIQRLRTAIRRACRPYENLRSPPANVRSEIARLPRAFEHALEMTREDSVSTNVPLDVARRIEQTLLRAQRATRGVQGGQRPFPCRSAPFSELRRLRSAGNVWSGQAASNVLRVRDRICQRLGTDPIALRRNAEGLERTLQQTELSLRSARQSLQSSLRQTRASIR